MDERTCRTYPYSWGDKGGALILGKEGTTNPTSHEQSELR